MMSLSNEIYHKVLFFYTVLQALAIDVVLGAVLLLWTLEKYFKVEIPFIIYLVLAITTWLIYTTDHLLDTRHFKPSLQSSRREFHFRYRKLLWVLMLILSSLEFLLSFYLPLPILETGFIGMLFILTYLFLTTKSFFWQKELCVALGYTFGIFSIPLVLLKGHITWVQYFFVFQIFILALYNLMLFSWYEMREDLQGHFTSMVIKMGSKKTEAFLKCFFMLGIFSCIISILGAHYNTSIVIQILVLLMFLILFTLQKKKHFFAINYKYRIIGDSIFFLPALSLIYIYWQ